MATIKVLCYRHKVLKDGSSPIMLRVSKGQGKNKYFSLGFNAVEKQFDDENECFVKKEKINPSNIVTDENGRKIKSGGFKEKNDFIDMMKVKAKDIIAEFERNNIDWTFNMFEDKFRKKSNRKLVEEYLKYFIDKLEEQKKFGNATVYKDLHIILKAFDSSKNIKLSKLYFQDFDYNLVEKFYLFLQNDREIKDNSMSVYLRTLRSLMNKAIEDGCGSKESYCFSNKYSTDPNRKIFKIKDLSKTTAKRYIPKQYLKKLRDTVFEREVLEYSKHLFLLSFYCYGCSYMDLAKLKKSDIEYKIINGKQVREIHYKRSKTHKDYSVQIRPEIQEQLDWFSNHYTTVGDFLLPCVTKDVKDQELHKHIINRRKKYNGYLKEVGKALNFPEAIIDLTTYFSRHSYAMAMHAKGERMEIIQEALGHESINTTKIYIDSCGSDAIAKASNNLID